MLVCFQDLCRDRIVKCHQPGLDRSLRVAFVKEVEQFPPPLKVSRLECLGFLGHVAV